MGLLPLFELVLQPGLGEGEGLGGAAEEGGQHQGLHLVSRLGTLTTEQKITLRYYLHTYTRHGENIMYLYLYISVQLYSLSSLVCTFAVACRIVDTSLNGEFHSLLMKMGKF